jgi:hypothetical protein
MINEIGGMIKNINADNIVPMIILLVVVVVILANVLKKVKEAISKVLRIVICIAVVIILYGAKQGMLEQWLNSLKTYLG